MDPLSVTTSVLAVLHVSTVVGTQLRAFRDDAAVVDATLDGFLNDIEGLSHVMESMKETFGKDEISSNLQTTGHVGSHWKNLARSLNDSMETLKQMQQLLENVNKTTTFLDTPRKQIRYRNAMNQIVAFRDQIHSYRGALQLSLSTVILWNQVTFQKATNSLPEIIQPNLEKLYDEFRYLGASLNARIESLQAVVSDRTSQRELTSMNNLRECIRSAADVVSTASTTLTADVREDATLKIGSELGDIFPQSANEAMSRWMKSQTIYEYDHMDSIPLPPGLNALNEHNDYHSDSDSDIETDIVRALFETGRKCQDSGDLLAAERHFKNCLARLPSNIAYFQAQDSTESTITKADVLKMLVQTYSLQENWDKAKSAMQKGLSLSERRNGSKDERYYYDTLKLSQLLMRNVEYVEAHLQARRSLRGFKKLGPSGHEGYKASLELLIQLAQLERNKGEEEAYSVLLMSHRSISNGDSEDSRAKPRSLRPDMLLSRNSFDSEQSAGSSNKRESSHGVEGPRAGIDDLVVGLQKSPSWNQSLSQNGSTAHRSGNATPFRVVTAHCPPQIHQSHNEQNASAPSSYPPSTLLLPHDQPRILIDFESEDTAVNDASSEINGGSMSGSSLLGMTMQEGGKYISQYDAKDRSKSVTHLPGPSHVLDSYSCSPGKIEGDSTTEDLPSAMATMGIRGKNTISLLDSRLSCPSCGVDMTFFSEVRASLHLDVCLGEPDQSEALSHGSVSRPRSLNGVIERFRDKSINNASPPARQPRPRDLQMPDRRALAWVCRICANREHPQISDYSSSRTARYISVFDDFCPICGFIKDDRCEGSGERNINWSGYTIVWTALDSVRTNKGNQLRQRNMFLLGDRRATESLLKVFSEGQPPLKKGMCLNHSRLVQASFDCINLDASVFDGVGVQTRSTIRRTHYAGTHIILLCFDISDPRSFQNIIRVWNVEADTYMYNAPKILVGLRKALRFEPSTVERLFLENGSRPVLITEAEDLAVRINALAYFEVASLRNVHCDPLFSYAAHAALVKGTKRSRLGRLFGKP